MHDGMEFIKNAGIVMHDSSLFFTIHCNTSNINQAKNYVQFCSNLINDLDLYDNEDILKIINSISKTNYIKNYNFLDVNIDSYYSGDLESYILKDKNIKFIDLNIDFRDKVFPFIFDGMYYTELCISYAKDRMQRCYSFECSTTDEMYEKIKSTLIDKVVILILSNYETNAILFKDMAMLNLTFPSKKEIAADTKIHQLYLSTNTKTSFLEDKKYVYIASNPYMTVLKIGSSSNPKERLASLSSNTAVPSNFRLEYTHIFKNATKVERFIINSFAEKGYRVSNNREFFNIPLSEAISFIDNLNEDDIQ